MTSAAHGDMKLRHKNRFDGIPTITEQKQEPLDNLSGSSGGFCLIAVRIA